MGALLAVGLEAAQLAALPFLALRAAGAAPPAWVGCFGTLLGFADAVTVYIDAAEEATTVPMFWAAFGLVCLWLPLRRLRRHPPSAKATPTATTGQHSAWGACTHPAGSV